MVRSLPSFLALLPLLLPGLCLCDAHTPAGTGAEEADACQAPHVHYCLARHQHTGSPDEGHRHAPGCPAHESFDQSVVRPGTPVKVQAPALLGLLADPRAETLPASAAVLAPRL